MSFLVQLTNDEARDLEAICDYIDRLDEPGRSNHVLDQIEKASRGRSEHPLRGNHPKELRQAKGPAPADP